MRRRWPNYNWPWQSKWYQFSIEMDVSPYLPADFASCSRAKRSSQPQAVLKPRSSRVASQSITEHCRAHSITPVPSPSISPNKMLQSLLPLILLFLLPLTSAQFQFFEQMFQGGHQQQQQQPQNVASDSRWYQETYESGMLPNSSPVTPSPPVFLPLKTSLSHTTWFIY